MERFVDHLVVLDLSADQLSDAPAALRRAARSICLRRGAERSLALADAALLRLLADQLDEAAREDREPVEVEFATRGEQGAA